MSDEKEFSETETWRTAHVYDVEPTIARDWGPNDFDTDPPKPNEPASIGPVEAMANLNESIGLAIRSFGEAPELVQITIDAAVVGLILKERNR